MSHLPVIFDISEDEEDKPKATSSNSKNNNTSTITTTTLNKKRKNCDSPTGSDTKETIFKKVKQDNRATAQKSIDSFRKKQESGKQSSKVCVSVISDSSGEEDESLKPESTILISSDEEDDGIDSSVQNILNNRNQSSGDTKPSKTPSETSSNSSSNLTKPKSTVQTFLEFKKKKSLRKDSDSESGSESESEEKDKIVSPEKVSRILRKTRERKNVERDLEDFIVRKTEDGEEEEEEEEANSGEEGEEDFDGSEEETEEDDEYIPNSQGDDLDLISLESDDEIDPDLRSIFQQETKKESELKERMKKKASKIGKLTDLVDAGNGWKKDSDEDYHLDGGFILDRDIYTKLYSFQKEGIKWLNNRFNAPKNRGGILADEMGLGKTVQVSAFLGGLASSDLTRRYLIIAPLSVLQTWASELDKWAPNLKVFVFHGLTKNQYSSMAKDFHGCAKRKKSAVIITTFRTLVSYTSTFASLCEKQDFDVTVVDEAHQIKNDQTGIAKNLRKITSKGKFCLTGTPIMNKLMEMWALYDYVFYGDNILGDKKEFKTNYERYIVKSRKRDASNTEKLLGNKLSQQMRSLIQPYILRRQKNQVLESDHNVGLGKIIKKQSTGKAKISQKNELVLWSYLSKTQDNVYTQYLKSEIVRQILGKKNRSCIFSALSTLKMLCNHPRLNNGSAELLNKELNEDEAFESFISEGDDKQTDALDTSGISCKQLVEESSKLQIIVKLLKEHKATGHRTLIFSQYKTMLDIVERIITEHLKYKSLRIDGSVAAKERQARVELFQKNNVYSCFLLTTGSGGVGLTLTAADRVILIDPHWNPAVDQQAVDRAYRVGQTKNVVTYRLITVGTLEEVIYRRQVIKDGLIKNTLTKENQYRYFTSDQELLEVFTLRDKRSSETKKLLDELHPKGEIYEELGKHVKALEEYSQVDGVTWHDMLYNIESDDLNETFNYEEDAFIQQKHTITSYMKKLENVVDLSSPNNRNQATASSSRPNPKLHIKRNVQQHPIQLPTQFSGVPDPFMPNMQNAYQHMVHPSMHNMPTAFLQYSHPQHHHIQHHPQHQPHYYHPNPQQQPTFSFQPNHLYQQHHETISPHGVPLPHPPFYPSFPPQLVHNPSTVSSSIDITDDEDAPQEQPYYPPNSQEEPELIDDEDEVEEQPPKESAHVLINMGNGLDPQEEVETDGELNEEGHSPVLTKNHEKHLEEDVSKRVLDFDDVEY